MITKTTIPYKHATAFLFFSARSKVQKAKDAKDCKREFHVQGACHPFHDHPEFDDDGNGEYEDEDGEIPSDLFSFSFSDQNKKGMKSIFFCLSFIILFFTFCYS